MDTLKQQTADFNSALLTDGRVLKIIMKTMLALFILVINFSLMPLHAQVRKRVSNGPVRVSGIEAEARRVAENYWDGTMSRCGDSLYGYERNSRGGLGEVYQLKNPAVQVDANKLTEVDRMNGFEWSGNTVISFRAYRTHDKGEWSEWRPQPGMFDRRPSLNNVFNFNKRNGKWTIQSADNPPFYKISCNLIQNNARQLDMYSGTYIFEDGEKVPVRNVDYRLKAYIRYPNILNPLNLMTKVNISLTPIFGRENEFFIDQERKATFTRNASGAFELTFTEKVMENLQGKNVGGRARKGTKISDNPDDAKP